MLRGRLGDASFLKLLRQLATDYADKPLTTENFRRHAAALLPKGSTDPELQTFFESWVYGTGIPHLELTSLTKGLAPRLQLELTLKQTGVPEDFAIDVPVEITLPRGQKVIRWLRTGPEPETATITLPAKPLKVAIDPHFGVLRK
jgi:aminopeptidase N